jgi:hypothetical protein
MYAELRSEQLRLCSIDELLMLMFAEAALENWPTILNAAQKQFILAYNTLCAIIWVTLSE